MKKSLIAIAALAVASLAAHATGSSHGPAGQSSVTSGSSIVLSAGVGGGSASGGVANHQSAYLAPSTNVGGAGTVFGQSIGGAAVAGGATTSSLTVGNITSTGAAGGEIKGGGTSQAIQSQANNYATQNNVKGSVTGSLALNSNSNLQAADNGGGVIGGSAAGNYAAVATSSATGWHSSTRTADTAVLGSATTSAPLTTSWGNSAYGLTNNSTITAGATSQSGSITSNNGNPGSGSGGNGGNNGGGNGNGCSGGGNCGVGNGNGGGNGTGNEGGGNGPNP